MTHKANGSRFCRLVTILSALLFLVIGGEASAQPRPMPAPSVLGGGSSDLFPFLVGGLFFLTVLTVVIGVVLLPLLAKGFGGSIDEGSACLISIPLAILALATLWKPLHLTEACVWVTLGGLILFVLGMVAAIGSTIFQNWEEAFFIGVVVITTTGFYLKTTWGFWLSLLAGVGVMLLAAGACDVFGWLVRLAKKSLTPSQGQAR